MDQAEADKAIKACLGKTDDGEALSCLIETIGALQQAEGICRPQLVLLTQENCNPCDEERAIRKDAISRGIIQEVDINCPRGRQISKNTEVNWTPALLPLDCEDNLIEEPDA